MKFLDEETKEIVIENLLINGAVYAVAGLAFLFTVAAEKLNNNHHLSEGKTPIAITQKSECKNQPTIR
jgi:hypothetical protein